MDNNPLLVFTVLTLAGAGMWLLALIVVLISNLLKSGGSYDS